MVGSRLAVGHHAVTRSGLDAARRWAESGAEGRRFADDFPATVIGVGRETSDEAYVLELCDEVLGEVGARQHLFDWLLGDAGKSGARRRLPVDGYWSGYGLVVEYRELQHDRATPHFDKPDRMTVSGVHRGEQRRLYDLRREELIPAHGLRLVIVKPSDLDADSRGRLRRSRAADLEALRRLLA